MTQVLRKHTSIFGKVIYLSVRELVVINTEPAASFTFTNIASGPNAVNNQQDKTSYLKAFNYCEGKQHLKIYYISHY